MELSTMEEEEEEEELFGSMSTMELFGSMSTMELFGSMSTMELSTMDEELSRLRVKASMSMAGDFWLFTPKISSMMFLKRGMMLPA